MTRERLPLLRDPLVSGLRAKSRTRRDGLSKSVAAETSTFGGRNDLLPTLAVVGIDVGRLLPPRRNARALEAEHVVSNGAEH